MKVVRDNNIDVEIRLGGFCGCSNFRFIFFENYDEDFLIFFSIRIGSLELGFFEVV